VRPRFKSRRPGFTGGTVGSWPKIGKGLIPGMRVRLVPTTHDIAVALPAWTAAPPTGRAAAEELL